ncbi:MAG TPA: endonuclease/exonuclease/phosphatase family protein [Fimbriimonas sp.]|nr:endonuclease/exonuclease/phosphatase family protein [Fimbriimonas sp.]
MKKHKGRLLLSGFFITAILTRTVVGRFSEANWFTYQMVHNAILAFVPLSLLFLTIALIRKKDRILCLALVVAIWFIFADPALRFPLGYREERDFRILSYNIAHGDISLPGVIEDIRKVNADIVCLQEAGKGDKERAAWAQSIAAELGYQSVQKSNNAVLSRFPMRLEHTINAPTKWPTKEFPEVVITTPKGDVRLVSVHMEPSWVGGLPPRLDGFIPTINKVVKDRRAQAEQLLERVRMSKEPILLVGDFNGPPYTEIPRKLDKELIDTFAEVGVGCGMTLLASLPYQRIDYAYAKGLTPTRAEVISSGASDHQPVVFEYRF